MKLVLVVLVAMLGVACERPLVIYNGCNRSWVRVVDGRGRILTDRLDYGREASVDIRGYAGSSIELLASGYELGTDRPLGSATTTRYIPTSPGRVTGPSQIQPWQISYLYTTDPSGGCQR